MLILLACKAEVAPKTLDDLSVAALGDFYAEGEGDTIAELRDWLVDRKEDWPEGWSLRGIGADDVADMQYSSATDFDKVLGAGVPYIGEGKLDDYVAIVPEEDQSFADPTYDEWSRTILEGSASEFEAGGDLKTDNHIEKTNFGVTVPYDALKDYRWFDDVVAFRTSVPEQGWAEDDKNGIICGFTIEIWSQLDDGVLWYNASWTDMRTQLDEFGYDDDWKVKSFIGGTIDYFQGTEQHANGED